MKKIIPLMAVVLLSVMVLSSCGYNSMQEKEEATFKAWGDLEAQLQRRMDLIPNLVATVKGYASHERETLEAVVEARAKATSTTINAGDLGNKQAMEQFLAA